MIIVAREYNEFPANPGRYDIIYRIDQNKIFIATIVQEVETYVDLPVSPQLYDICYVRDLGKYYVCTALVPSVVWTEKNYSLVFTEHDYDAKLPDLYRARDSLTRVRYLARDWGTHVDEMKAFLVAHFPDYEDFLDSDFGNVLIQMFAVAADTLGWYQDKKASEGFLETAVLRTNVVKIAKMLGYTPGRAVPSEVQLDMKLSVAQTFDFVVPQGWRFTVKDLIFELKNDVKFYSGETTLRSEEQAKAIAVQVKTLNMSFFSDGTKNQRFLLNELEEGEAIAQETFNVEIMGERWTEVDAWSYEWRKEYMVEYSENPPVLVFGDGIVSQIPPAGNEIKVRYKVTKGSAGNLKTIGQKMGQETPLTIFGNKIPLEVANKTKGIVGSDEETLEHIKVWAPKLYLTQDRAVTLDDFETLAMKYVNPIHGSAAKVKAMVVKSIDDDPFLKVLVSKIPNAVPTNGGFENVRQEMEDYLNGIISGGRVVNLVRVYVLQVNESNEYISPSDEFLNGLLAYLMKKKLATVDVKVASGYQFLRHATIEAKIKVADKYDPTTVKNNVVDVLTGMLTLREFGVNLALSDVYTAVRNVDGVTNVWAEIRKRASETDVIISGEGDMVIKDYMVIVKGSLSGEGVIVNLWE